MSDFATSQAALDIYNLRASAEMVRTDHKQAHYQASTAQQQHAQTELSQQQSATLMRNLLRTAMSSICYLRHLFPEDCFQDRFLTGVPNFKSMMQYL